MALDLPSYLMGKSRGGGGGTSDYSQLSNKPSINGVTLSGNKTNEDLGLSSGDIVYLDYNDTSADAIAKIQKAINNHKNSGLYVSVVNTSNRKNFLLYSYINPSSSSYGFDYEYLKNYTYKWYYTVSVSGEWQNGTYTVSSISYNQSQMGFTALSTLNTTSYTPTSDYHPATKKYVDDLVGNINTVLATLTTPNNGGN